MDNEKDNVLTETIEKTARKTRGFLKKQAVETPTVEETKPMPTFAKVEEAQPNVDYLALRGKNPAYEYHWCQESKVSNGRSGPWLIVDKFHPDFKTLKVVVDHTPEATSFKYRDLILGCMRTETAENRRKAHHLRTKGRSERIASSYKENVKKIQHSLGNRSEAMRVMDEIDEQN